MVQGHSLGWIFRFGAKANASRDTLGLREMMDIFLSCSPEGPVSPGCERSETTRSKSKSKGREEKGRSIRSVQRKYN